MKHLLLLASLILVSFSCASKKLKNVDDEIDVKGTMGDKQIGLNKSEEAVIQESVAVEDELRKLNWENYETERKLTSERDRLIACRTDMADPRLSGNKKLDPIPELEISEDLSKVQNELGITDAGRIKVIKKEFLKDRMEKETRYRESLGRLLKVISSNRENCDRELGYIRVQHGLPSERYKAEGHYNSDGNFIVTREAEHNLDDAFRIQAQQRKAKKKVVTKKAEETKTEESTVEE